MADDILLDAAPSGEKVATDQETGTDRHFQWLKLRYGANDTFTIVEATNGLPIQGDGTDLPITLAGEAVVLGAGTAAIGKLATNNGVDIGDVDVTSIAAGTNLVGDVGLSGARTSGGSTFFSSLGTCTLQQIKGAAGQLYWINVISLKASVLYLQMFNKASASVTLGTTVPDLVFPIPTSGNTNGAGFNFSVPNGIAMGTGISFAVTTTETGATAATVNEAYVNAGYA